MISVQYYENKYEKKLSLLDFTKITLDFPFSSQPVVSYFLLLLVQALLKLICRYKTLHGVKNPLHCKMSLVTVV